MRIHFGNHEMLTRRDTFTEFDFRHGVTSFIHNRYRYGVSKFHDIALIHLAGSSAIALPERHDQIYFVNRICLKPAPPFEIIAKTQVQVAGFGFESEEEFGFEKRSISKADVKVEGRGRCGRVKFDSRTEFCTSNKSYPYHQICRVRTRHLSHPL